jgi:hypothetical protein
LPGKAAAVATELTTSIGDGDSATLEAVADQIDAAASEERAAASTVRELAAQRRKGSSWTHIATHGGLRAALERIGDGVQVLRGGAARLRRTAARGMVEEGTSTRQIGRLFGVSHQRVSAIVSNGDVVSSEDSEEREGSASP